MKGAITDLFPRGASHKYRREYLKYIYFKHRALSTPGPFNLELQNVFVEPSVSPDLKKGGYSIWKLLANEKINHLVIIGPPGSGKTTLLKHMALCLAGFAKLPKGENAPDRLPILLFLRDHAQTIADNPKTPLAKLIYASLATTEPPAPAGWFEKHLQNGQCVVMLDGLDEIADPAIHQQALRWLDAQIGALGRNIFIVTSRRPISHPLAGVNVVEVRPFNRDQVKRLVENWYLANEMMAQPKNGSGVKLAASKGATDLLKRIGSSSEISELAVNPLLLTMLATVHRFHGSLPGRRVELYAQMCEVLVGQRNNPAPQMSILQPLAYELMCRQRYELSTDEALSAQISGPDIKNDSGLLLERENGTYAFAHPTFQEYLAAVHIKEQGLENVLIEHLDDTWWHATIRFYCAANGGSAIIAACLPPNGDRFALAVQCIDEIPANHQLVRDAIEAAIAAYSESQDKDLWTTAADALLKLRLKRLRPLNEDTYVDASSITYVEYQLFLEQHPDEGYAPDHWPSPRFEPGTAIQPIVGLTPLQSMGFLQWLNDTYGGEWHFRLPHQAEGRETGLYWVADGYDCQLATHQCLEAMTFEEWNMDGIQTIPALQTRLVRICFYNFLHPLAFTSMLALDRARNEIQALAPDRDDIFELDLALIRTLVYDLDRPRALTQARRLTSVLARVLGIDPNSLDLASVRALVQELSEQAGTAHYAVAKIMLGYLELAQLLESASPIFAIERNEGLSAYRAQLVQRANELMAQEPQQVNGGDNTAWDREIDLILQTYAMLVMLEKRRSGAWAAFEELRIVKARRTDPA